VATRASISKGLVQHHFPDRDRLLRHAATTLAARLGQRIGEIPADDAPAVRLAALLVALLPTTPDARLDEAAGRALFGLALTDPETNRTYRRGRAAITELVRSLVAHTSPDDDPDRDERTTRDLLGTLQELATDLLLGELTAEQAEHLLHRRVADITYR
jgi:TetR/AcrR family transcriptional repressor of bet genes